MKFRAKVIPSGNATGVEIPDQVRETLGPASRPLVVVTINQHSWRTRVAHMRGRFLVGISAANRSAANIAEGQMVEVDLELDTEPREVAEPQDLSDALNQDPEIRAGFDRLAYGLKCKHIRDIDNSKSLDTRKRRIEKLILMVRGGVGRGTH